MLNTLLEISCLPELLSALAFLNSSLEPCSPLKDMTIVDGDQLMLSMKLDNAIL